MLRNMPPRPARYEYDMAAFRIAENEYPSSLQSSRLVYALGRIGSIFTLRRTPGRIINHKRSDLKVARIEQLYEGYVPGEEDIAVFVSKQSARYKDLEKR